MHGRQPAQASPQHMSGKRITVMADIRGEPAFLRYAVFLEGEKPRGEISQLQALETSKDSQREDSAALSSHPN